MGATTIVTILWVCACVGALENDEQLFPVLQFWSPEGTRSFSRRDAPSKNVTPVTNDTIVNATDISPGTAAANATTSEKPGKAIDLGDPGVLRRGLLVFGGFGLLAAAYFVFYKRRRNGIEGDGAGKPADGPQFRYGVLQTDDRSDPMELSRMPLTMDSEEDDEDDLEIFDFGRRDPARAPPTDDPQAVRDILAAANADPRDPEHLLLDIEDTTVVPLTSAKVADVI